MKLPSTRRGILSRLEAGLITRSEAKRELLVAALLWRDISTTLAASAALAAIAYALIRILNVSAQCHP